MRRGITLIEAVVTVGIGVLVIGGIVVVFMSVGKMSQAGDLSSALQEAALALARIQGDLIQALPAQPAPNERTGRVFRAVPPDGYEIQLFDRTGAKPQKVAYARRNTPQQNFRIVRSGSDRTGTLPGVYSAMSLTQLEGAGGPFVRILLSISTHDLKSDEKSKGGAELTTVSTLVRVASPEMSASRLLSWEPAP